MNLVFNHVGISVPNLEDAATWYIDVLGFRRIRPDTESDRNIEPNSAVFGIYGNSLQKVKMAYLSTGNGVGFEIFEFVDPTYKKPNEFDYTRGGFFHVAITVADPDAMAQKVIEHGGKRIGETVELYGERALYLQDPWGNVLEFLSCSFHELMANRA